MSGAKIAGKDRQVGSQQRDTTCPWRVVNGVTRGSGSRTEVVVPEVVRAGSADDSGDKSTVCRNGRDAAEGIERGLIYACMRC